MSTTQEFTSALCRGFRLVATGDDGPRQACELDHAVSILGSGDWCDVILESPDVADAHAAIVKYAGSGYLCDLGARGGAMLNGRLVRWARLTSGDRVKVGPFEFQVEIDEEVTRSGMTHPIFALRGDDEIGLVTSIDPVLLIGSDGGSDIVLKDPGVSPRHCLIVWSDRGPLARDLTGDRLSFVNGRPIATALLADGCTVGAGSYEFVFEIESEPTMEQTVGGRFSNGTEADPTSRLGTPGLIAARFAASNGETQAESTGRSGVGDEDFEDAPVATQSRETGLVKTNRPNYFNRIVETAGADLAEMAEMEARAESEAGHEELAEEETASGAHDVAGESPELTTGMTPEAILRKAEQLQRKTAEMRRRVADAQKALDARAEKHREEILRERHRLREKRALLQMQAKALVEAAKSGRKSEDDTPGKSVALDGRSDSGNVLEIHDEPAQRAFVEYVANESSVRRLLSGAADLEELSDFNAKETDRILNDPRSYAEEESLKTLEDRVAELIRVAQSERKEIERGEALVETLRFETERQRRTLTRRQEKLQSREKSLEDRFRSLTKARDAIRKERAPLLARLKALDADEAVIRDRLSESERLHQDLVREAEAIDELQEGLETRERALLHKLELERQRLLARQTQLKRKAAQLAKAAREKRLAIEKEMVRQQADLEAREAELRAQRMAIEESARGELEKTAGNIEQVLSVRLSEIEAELESRRMDLDTKVQELAGLNHAHLKAAREANDPIDASLRRIASEFTGIYQGSEDETEVDSRHGALDNLAAEIDAFSRRNAKTTSIESDKEDASAMCEDTDGSSPMNAIGKVRPSDGPILKLADEVGDEEAADGPALDESGSAGCSAEENRKAKPSNLSTDVESKSSNNKDKDAETPTED